MYKTFKASMIFFLTLTMAPACQPSVEQTEACNQYVACVQAQDEVLGESTNLDRYLEDGPCWGSPEGGELCDQSCIKGLDFIRDRYTDLPGACQ